MKIEWEQDILSSLWWRVYDSRLSAVSAIEILNIEHLVKGTPLYKQDENWFISNDDGSLRIVGVEEVFRERWSIIH